MKITPHYVTLSRSCEGSRIKQRDSSLSLRMTHSALKNDRRYGYTLIEVILAILVVTIAVSATLVIMSKMMGYTVNRGQAVDISNAITISQMAIDQVRDQKFPPTWTSGDLDSTSEIGITISGINYTYKTEIVASDGSGTTTPINFPTTEYNNMSPNTDEMLGYRNLLQVTVTVYKNGRPLLKTVTYKTRNGYY